MNSGYSEPPDIVNFLAGPFEFTIMRVHCTYRDGIKSRDKIGIGYKSLHVMELLKCAMPKSQ